MLPENISAVVNDLVPASEALQPACDFPAAAMRNDGTLTARKMIRYFHRLSAVCRS
jgi:hypothetical protein